MFNNFNYKVVKMINISLAEIWDVCVDKIYDRETYIKSLDNLLKRENVKSIIDPACGTGKPSLDLLKLGYDVDFSDGSEEMLKQFYKNSGYKIKPKLIDWRDLSKHYKDQFDFVLVRSNSLIYATSWGKKELNSGESKEAILNSLKNFYEILKNDGILYVDLYSKGEKPHTKNISLVVINNDVEIWKWVIKHDWQNRVRYWGIIRENLFSKEKREQSSLSYLIKHQELIDMLKKTGFRDINKANLEGTFYTTYLARK